MIGSYGNRWANLAVGMSDCIVVIGSRLDVRQTGADTTAWKGERRVFHIDCSPGEINHRILGCEAIVADARDFLREAVQVLPERVDGYKEWLQELSDLRKKWPDTKELNNVQGINPNVFMHQLSAHSKKAAAYIADVGQHQMWAAQSLELTENQRFLTCGGMGAMGFGLPASIGAAFVSHSQPVVLIAGDGAFQLNIQELQTIVRNKLPIKMIVINNRCHGMVRQFQERYFEGRYQSTVWGYDGPDFANVAAAYGIEARTIASPRETDDALTWLWQSPEEPCLLQVMIDQVLNVYPKIAFGRPMTEMEPFAKPLGMEGT